MTTLFPICSNTFKKWLNTRPQYLTYLKNNNSQNEYYLTDIIEIIKREEGFDVGMLKIPQENVYEILGVNTIEQLKDLEKLIIKNKIESKNIIENNDIQIK